LTKHETIGISAESEIKQNDYSLSNVRQVGQP